jgi:diaminopimelate decarboxylase
LPEVERIVIEPGKAVSQSSAVLVTSVVETRASKSGHDVVVDASIADLPTAGLQPHRILHLSRSGAAEWLGRGPSRVLGAICMEHDVLASHVSFLRTPEPGDRLLVFDSGAYDVSMAWPFAQGVTRDS